MYLKLIFLALTIFVSVLSQGPVNTIVSTGYSSELYTFDIDFQTGLILFKNSQPVDDYMSWISFNKDVGYLYATHEVEEYGEFSDTGVISWWSLDVDNVTWIKEGLTAVDGLGPAHHLVDYDNKFIYVSNYGQGNFVVKKLNDDFSIGQTNFMEQFSEGSGVVPGRQNLSHIHHSAQVNNYIYVVDLGSDRLHHYRVSDDGSTVEKADPMETVCRPGSGPRHLAFDSNRNIMYLINELQMNIDVFEFSDATGELVRKAVVDYTIENMQDIEQKGAEIVLHPNGNFLYISHRGDDRIIVFQVTDEAGGYLQQIQEIPSLGLTRHFTITPSGMVLIAAARDQHKIETYLIEEDGLISRVFVTDSELNPSIIEFIA